MKEQKQHNHPQALRSRLWLVSAFTNSACESVVGILVNENSNNRVISQKDSKLREKSPNSFSGYEVGPLAVSESILKITEQSWKY